MNPITQLTHTHTQPVRFCVLKRGCLPNGLPRKLCIFTLILLCWLESPPHETALISRPGSAYPGEYSWSHLIVMKPCCVSPTRVHTLDWWHYPFTLHESMLVNSFWRQQYQGWTVDIWKARCASYWGNTLRNVMKRHNYSQRSVNYFLSLLLTFHFILSIISSVAHPLFQF